jgi:hypothetical protein
MEIDKFITINYSKYEGMLIMEITVNHALPTQLQWTFALEDLKTNLDNVFKSNINFGFVFDITKVGLVSFTHIKEFIQVIEVYADLLESKLYGTSAIAQGSIIKQVFDLINLFYKTKKPLKIVDNRDNALLFLKECKV